MMKVILNVSCALILISTFLFNTTDFFTNYIIMASQDKPFKRCNIYCRTKLNRKQTVVVDVRYSPSKSPTFLVMDQPCFPAYINDLPQYMIYNKFRLIADVSKSTDLSWSDPKVIVINFRLIYKRLLRGKKTGLSITQKKNPFHYNLYIK